MSCCSSILSPFLAVGIGTGMYKFALEEYEKWKIWYAFWMKWQHWVAFGMRTCSCSWGPVWVCKRAHWLLLWGTNSGVFTHALLNIATIRDGSCSWGQILCNGVHLAWDDLISGNIFYMILFVFLAWEFPWAAMYTWKVISPDARCHGEHIWFVCYFNQTFCGNEARALT